MAHTNSPLGQLTGVVPASADPPDVAGDFSLLITAVEKKLNMRFASRTARDSVVTSPVDGMVTHIDDVGEIDRRIAGAWVKIWPTKYSGTSAPANTLGVVGDWYAQYS